jgi:hypothetical protein
VVQCGYSERRNHLIISLINYSDFHTSDGQLQKVVRAVNRQIAEDFEPCWGMGAELRVQGKSCAKPQKQSVVDMRGDAVIYLWDDTHVQDALGYHDENNRGIPFGFVFPTISKEAGENWTVTLSHEALELIGDPEANLLVQGPHPEHPDNTVFHWFEMCDAVQAETYEIDGMEVSNFLLPLYFTSGEEKGGRNDFLSNRHDGKTLRSFGVNPGGYIGFYDPASKSTTTYTRPDDKLAARKLQIKGKTEIARRTTRVHRKLRVANA